MGCGNSREELYSSSSNSSETSMFSKNFYVLEKNDYVYITSIHNPYHDKICSYLSHILSVDTVSYDNESKKICVCKGDKTMTVSSVIKISTKDITEYRTKTTWKIPKTDYTSLSLECSRL